MVRRWNVLNAEDPSNSSVDKIGKFLVQEALSVIAKQKQWKMCVIFWHVHFLKEKIFLHNHVWPSVCSQFHDTSNLRQQIHHDMGITLEASISGIFETKRLLDISFMDIRMLYLL